ncbi:hypothetical protein VCR14J2_260411 [Vibrio coralliirubri]|uniref:hypothetical protein n=1 Tax=Vibrio coralliirubri TaxID=1516159 RepID=UPI0006347AD7|nr:hypothetical protein [Vibrio coralliirubri]CDT98642.1 hypothetical protein VCR14J2_260411 [Vibrio coralliirubri]
MSPPYEEQFHSSASNPSNQQSGPSGSTEFQWTMQHLNKLDDKVSKHISEISELNTTVKHQSSEIQDLKTSVTTLSDDVNNLKRVIYTAGIVFTVVAALGMFFFGSTVQDVMSSIQALSETPR